LAVTVPEVAKLLKWIYIVLTLKESEKAQAVTPSPTTTGCADYHYLYEALELPPLPLFYQFRLHSSTLDFEPGTERITGEYGVSVLQGQNFPETSQTSGNNDVKTD